VIALGILLAWCPIAFALNPSLAMNQYAHTAWKVRDGFSKGTIHHVAQTPDGYLWLATEFGLLRFDGVRSVPWQPPAGEGLPSSDIRSVLSGHDGRLWMGTAKGLASWKDGKLTHYTELAGQDVITLFEDREGTVWAGGWAVPAGRLCAIQGGRAECYGEDGSFGHGVHSFNEDSEGHLWTGTDTGLWRWKPGAAKQYPSPVPVPEILALIEDSNGTLLMAMDDGVRKFVNGKTVVYPLLDTGPQFGATGLLRDRDGGLWIGTSDRGLVHVHQGKTDLFAQSDGLSGDDIQSLFEDREGNIWVATAGGIDRFRDLAVPTISVKQGLSNAAVSSVLAARDGSVWLGSYHGLNRLHDGQITIYRERSARTAAENEPGALREVRKNIDAGLPDDGSDSLFEDDRGRIWVATLHGVAYFEHGRFVPVNGVPGGYVNSIVEDSARDIWISDQNQGLFHLVRGSVVERIPWAKLGRKDSPSVLVADPLQGGLWIGSWQGGVAYFREGQIRTSYSVADGLGEGRVNGLQLDRNGTLWAATQGGLSRAKNGRFATLTSRNGLPCDTVHEVVEDDAHSFWLYMACGLVRIARPELDSWAASVDAATGDNAPNRSVEVTVFDALDGVRSHAGTYGFGPRVAKTKDGKLWFLPLDGVSVIDPRHLPFNQLPPPVHIEQITADRKTYEAFSNLRLPPLVRDVWIDYTALSFVAPEKIRFRYKLEGQDRDWKEVVNDREAQYSNLAPGNYRFRVTACNNSGVWNEAGAFLDFSVGPAYYQTAWFRGLCAAAFALLLWLIYQLRLRQLARQFNMGLEARVRERTRIARELHDTLLQSFHGLLLRFQSASNLLPERPAEAKQRFESAIDQAAQAITEGRDAVQGLRSSMVETNNLARAISALGEQLVADEPSHNSPVFHVHVEGTPRNLHPILRDEVYRIAAEALRNAFRHACAKRVEVEIRFDERQLRLRVRDDGKGIDPNVLKEGGRAGHWGLSGMRERAKLIGGNLELWSELDSGMEVELSIPASSAYRTSAGPRRSWLAEKLSGKGTDMKS
jgi:signal transduction histidine kinase/ligand-binding sensor domain-containing protein